MYVRLHTIIAMWLTTDKSAAVFKRWRSDFKLVKKSMQNNDATPACDFGSSVVAWRIPRQFAVLGVDVAHLGVLRRTGLVCIHTSASTHPLRISAVYWQHHDYQTTWCQRVVSFPVSYHSLHFLLLPSPSAITTCGFCTTGLIFQRSLQFRPGLLEVFGDCWCRKLGEDFYKPDALPVSQIIVSKHWRKTGHCLV